MKKDLFISHASEDKEIFVKPLADTLMHYGVNVWYDEFELKIGSSLSRSIDKGINNSKYGLLILSKAFFSKNWTEYELKSLNSFEVEKGDVLLPIWKDVSVKDVREFSPYLADKFALNANQGFEEIAEKIIEVIRPDIFSEIHLKLLTQRAVEEGKIHKTYNYEIFKRGYKKHLKLSENLISRIRLIRSALWTVYPNSMEFWLDGFQRDLNIEKEVRCWEHISTCFLELKDQYGILRHYSGAKKELTKDIFSIVISIILSGELSNELKKKFTSDFIKKAIIVCENALPLVGNIKNSNSLKKKTLANETKYTVSLENDYPKYWYEVEVFMTTFSKDEDGYRSKEIFNDEDLLEARKLAILYYNKEIDRLSRESQYKGLPFASPQEFVFGENAAFSVFFYFVTDYGHEKDYSLLSGDGGGKEHTITELANEILVLMEKGYDLRTIPAILFDNITIDELNKEIQLVLESRCG